MMSTVHTDSKYDQGIPTNSQGYTKKYKVDQFLTVLAMFGSHLIFIFR